MQFYWIHFVRKHWLYVLMIKSFVEHLAIEYPDVIVIANRYELVCDK